MSNFDFDFEHSEYGEQVMYVVELAKWLSKKHNITIDQALKCCEIYDAKVNSNSINYKLSLIEDMLGEINASICEK